MAHLEVSLLVSTYLGVFPLSFCYWVLFIFHWAQKTFLVHLVWLSFLKTVETCFVAHYMVSHEEYSLCTWKNCLECPICVNEVELVDSVAQVFCTLVDLFFSSINYWEWDIVISTPFEVSISPFQSCHYLLYLVRGFVVRLTYASYYCIDPFNHHEMPLFTFSNIAHLKINFVWY